MRFISRLILLCLLIVATQALAGNQIYRYKDDSGTLNFTTELYSIPEKYRHEAVSLVPESAAPPEPKAQEPLLRTVIATGEYRMEDHDTRMDATRMAVEAAKRQALEQVATYLESVTEVKDLDLTRDEIRTYTAGIVTVLSQHTRTRLENGAVVFHPDTGGARMLAARPPDAFVRRLKELGVDPLVRGQVIVATRRPTVGCVVWSARAAADSVPWRATARKMRRSSQASIARPQGSARARAVAIRPRPCAGACPPCIGDRCRSGDGGRCPSRRHPRRSGPRGRSRLGWPARARPQRRCLARWRPS